MQQQRPQKWFYGVDSIRFILALVVMLSHFDNVYAVALKSSALLPVKTAGVFLANAFDGTSAVVAFFIISGFVIHYPSKKGIANVPQFWVRRFLRILIPLVIIIIAGAWFGHPEQTVTWSLFCELIYYAIYPALLKIRISWKTKFTAAWVMAAVFIAIGAYSDVRAFIHQTNTNYHGYYWQFGNYLTWIVGLPCWLLGVLIAEHIDEPRLVNTRTVILYRLGVFAISCFCCFAKFHLHLSYILSMNVFALLLYKWIQTEIVYYKSQQPISGLEKMGKFSYSLYLCHPIIFLLLKRVIIFNGFTYPLFIGLTILAAYLFYLLIERPAHRLARSINRRYFTAA
ncbi:acyltransferase family protein [Mucilaginibacter phyllosphaerae]|uniref:Acyltransferase n=1 Tax=Mucilaginibacter phyllosphaerae TaxID=1812349 RepID=A0A4Y8AGE0_9SPHI|nr:acyltransferase family protein [Mucilaginibacter phyllosphaerae]MBB3968559.1 peptidoglycan/LPS O-acetylase OafA/YrhL [Mucilaginibacter phyllosphaerae]TEW67800.1 acyltransferase [Mucilaginibacter phyllosphaerae]GGH15233.1 LPS biosynthesis protein [Mucilaginibacter phyllosphaerae]